MGQASHGSAAATRAVRAAIQRSRSSAEGPHAPGRPPAAARPQHADGARDHPFVITPSTSRARPGAADAV